MSQSNYIPMFTLLQSGDYITNSLSKNVTAHCGICNQIFYDTSSFHTHQLLCRKKEDDNIFKKIEKK